MALAGLARVWPTSSAWAASPRELPDRTTGVGRAEGKLTLSVGLQDLFHPADAARLRSGFANQVLIRVSLHRAGSSTAVAHAFRRSDITFDIWDERFRVKVTEASGLTEAHDVASVTEAINISASLVRFPIADLDGLSPGVSYRVGFRADLNPISQELVREIHRWLSGASVAGGGGPSESFFGSFVSAFVNPRVDDSERQIRFFSQAFGVPRP
jgi:hypothetical protein